MIGGREGGVEGATTVKDAICDDTNKGSAIHKDTKEEGAIYETTNEKGIFDNISVQDNVVTL